MSAVAAPSLLWLLRHELRLQWRAVRNKKAIVIAIGLALVFLHVIAGVLAYGSRFMPPIPATAILIGVTCGAAFLLLMMISSGIVLAVQSIYARGDMDLLLSSPLAPRTLVVVRALAIAATLCGGACALILPFANMLALFVTAKWLLTYAALTCVALLGTGISLILAHGLFRLLGPRRTRMFAQVLGALLVAVVALVGQIPNAMPASSKQHATDGLLAMVKHGPALDSWVWLPAHAFMGDPLAMLLVASICCGVFAVATVGLAGALVGNSIAAAGVAAPRAPARRVHARRFRTATRSVLRRKETRLILRDPWLLAQIGQQMIFLAPAGLLLWQHGVSGMPAAWLLLIAVAGMLGSGIAWLAVSGEDASDLLGSAPVGPLAALRAKLEAVLLMVGAALIAPILVAWWADAWLGFTLLACCAGSAVTGALFEVMCPSPGKRSEFNKRAQGRPALGVIQLALVGCWALTGFLMLRHSLWALLPLPFLALIAIAGSRLR
jgi:ABC-2 type transport system permease protein